VTSDQRRLLDRVRKAAERVGEPVRDAQHPGAFQGYSWIAAGPGRDLAARFAEELAALSGHPHIVPDARAAAGIVLDILATHGCRRVLAWEPASALERTVWTEIERRGIDRVRVGPAANAVDRRLQLEALGDIVVGLTGARAALADTGAIVVTSGAGRPRLASLLPPVHVALVRQADLYPSLPAFLAAHPEAVVEGSNLVVITGPSRTADIEMTLSIGVHGPGEIHVIVAGDLERKQP